MIGDPRNKMLHVIWPIPFREIVIRGLGLATVNLCTIFESSTSIPYLGIKGDNKCGKWGGLG